MSKANALRDLAILMRERQRAHGREREGEKSGYWLQEDIHNKKIGNKCSICKAFILT